MKHISIQEFKSVVDQKKDNSICIDVRTPKEFRSMAVEGFENIPLNKLDSNKVNNYKNVFIICASGNRSVTAAKRLTESGLKDVYSISGGVTSWKRQGNPVIGSGKSVISIMRQVQIIVGIGVLSGIVGSFYSDPAWIGLSAFFGAGMLFSGLTGFCGMAIVLEKLPWNS